MKNLQYIWLACILLNVSCVNEIETEVKEGSVPITFSVQIEKPTTKVTNNAFDMGDEIGLYAMLAGKTVSEERYIDNLLLTCGEKNTLTSKDPVFYPEGDNALDFVAYYPYQPEGAQEGTATIPVSIQADQSIDDAYSASDFMTASKEQVVSSGKAVSLNFNHCFTNLKINLVPGGDVLAEEMVRDNPRIVATGFYTRANYNFDKQIFTDFEGVSDVVPMGTWELDEETGNLVGKELILIPQALDGDQAFQMEWNGRVYTCPMPDLEQLDGNLQYELEIYAEESESHMLNGVVASIAEWPVSDEEIGGVETEEGASALHLSALSFERSNIYNVHMNGKEIAEICKEYLLSDEWATRAIVSYPLLADGTADLTQGTVLQLLDVDEDINGGTLRWDEVDNTFTYHEGELAPVQAVYFDEDGVLCLEPPSSSVRVNVLTDMLYDSRDPLNIQQYSLVKIGTQYWMRENLKADRYVDGTELEEVWRLDGVAGYHKSETDGACFYSGEALLVEGKSICVDGWRIPSAEDWETLDAYIGGDVSLLKTGEWESLSGSGEVASAGNEAMMYIAPLGVWSCPDDEEANTNINRKKMAAFWTWDYDENTIPAETVFFIGEDNAVVNEATKTKGDSMYKGLSIRLIRN